MTRPVQANTVEIDDTTQEHNQVVEAAAVADDYDDEEDSSYGGGAATPAAPTPSTSSKKHYHSSAFTILSPTPKNKNDNFYDSDCESVGGGSPGSPLEATVSADAVDSRHKHKIDTVVRIDQDLIGHTDHTPPDNPFQNDRLTWQQNHTQRRPGSPRRGGGGGGPHNKYSNASTPDQNNQLHAYNYRSAGPARSEPGSPEVIQVRQYHQ